MGKVILALSLVIFTLSSVHLMPRKHSNVRPNTPENLERLKNLSADDLAELYSGQFEGDMVMSQEEIDQLLGRRGRTGITFEYLHWTNKEVPYTIREEDFTSAQIHYIHLAAQRLQEVTCLRFVKYQPEIHENYIYVTGENSGCWSYVGMQRGGQQLNLTPNNPEVGCFRLYTIVHEFLHALGFFHMQSATERDEYVEIVWDNIQPEMTYNFDKYNASAISQYGTEYDYGSVMHYPAKAFTINNQDTIVPLRDLGDNIMGQRLRLSESDIARVNNLYCPRTRPPMPDFNIHKFFARVNKKVNHIFDQIFGY